MRRAFGISSGRDCGRALLLATGQIHLESSTYKVYFVGTLSWSIYLSESSCASFAYNVIHARPVGSFSDLDIGIDSLVKHE